MLLVGQAKNHPSVTQTKLKLLWFLGWHFLFTCSDAFAVGCII